MFPRKAEKFDEFTSKKILLPIEDTVQDIFKIKHNDNEYYLDKNNNDWADRIKSNKTEKPTIKNI